MFIFNAKIELELRLSLRSKGIEDTVLLPLEPPFISYTKGKHTIKVKLGKLLAYLPDKEVKALVEEYKEINGDLSQFTIKYTRDYELIYNTSLYAIDSTTKSCMTGRDCVEVYGYDENLELLTIWKKVDTDTNILIGRTLVAWRNNEEEESVYVRLYLDHNHIKAHQATALTVREGFTKGNLEGIKIDKVEDSSGYVCPYLDGLDTLEDCGDHFTITRIDSLYRGNSTEGYMEDGSCTCESCGDRVLEEDIAYVSDMIICDNCIRNNYTYYCDEYYHNENCITTSDTNETIPMDCLGYAEVGEDRNGDFYSYDNLVLIDDEYFYIEEVYELAIEVDEDTKHAPREDCFRLSVDLTCADEGWYLREQLEDIKEEVKASILNLQEEISLRGEFMLHNQELKNLLTDFEVLEELV